MRPIVVAWLERFMPHGLAATLAPGWFTCVGLAGVVTLGWLMIRARRAAAHDRGIEPGVIATAVLWCYVAAVAAGIVVPMLIDSIEHRVATGEAHLRWAGMTSFWGYLAGTAAVALVCRDHRVSLGRLGDLAVAPLGIALVLARLGCFLGGCDFGKVSALPWAVRFPAGSPAWAAHVAAGLVPADRAESLPVHPTQLYEAALGLVICAFGLVAARAAWMRAREGRLFVGAAVLYALGRIGVETLRGDAGRGLYAGVSSGQIFSLVLLAVIAAAAVVARRRLARFAIAAAAVLAVIAPCHADAQPAPPPADAAYPQQPMAPPPPSTAAVFTSHLTIGALVGLAAPLNRRDDQVPALAGPSLSIRYDLGLADLWLDFDSFGNADASHGTVLFAAGAHVDLDKLRVGGRAGLGPTLVNFRDPTFQDVLGTSFRAEGMADYALTDAWTLWVRPIAFELLTAASLGGPILTYQVRAGIAYRFGRGRAAPQAAAPAQQPPPAPPPQAQPQPQTQPPALPPPQRQPPTGMPQQPPALPPNMPGRPQ